MVHHYTLVRADKQAKKRKIVFSGHFGDAAPEYHRLQLAVSEHDGPGHSGSTPSAWATALSLMPAEELLSNDTIQLTTLDEPLGNSVRHVKPFVPLQHPGDGDGPGGG